MSLSPTSRRTLDPRITVAAVYVAAQFMSVMDTTIVNVTLPTLAKRFTVTGASIDAVVVGYLISLAVFIPASGWLGDRFGTKRVFLFALSMFVMASVLCGLSGSFGQLVACRVLQGVGGGMLTPVGMAMLYRTFPPEQRVQASRILIIPTVFAPASGPVLGGLLVDKLSWRWVFFVNVPIGIAALTFGLLFLHEHREVLPGRFDLPGFLLAGSGFPLVMFALTEGPSRGWASLSIVGPAVAGVLILVAFVFAELRTPEPMVQLRLLGNRLFRSTILVSVTLFAGFLGLLFLVPLFLQEARGASALSSGLTTFPEALGVLTATQIAARIYPMVGPRRLMMVGGVIVAASMLLLLLVDLHTNAWVVRVLMYMGGFGMGNVFLPVQAAAFAKIPSSLTGRASTMFNALRQLGAATGVAVLSSVLAAVGATHTVAGGEQRPNLNAYHAAFLVAAAFPLVASLLALLISDKEAAATMVRRRGKAAASHAEEAVLVE